VSLFGGIQPARLRSYLVDALEDGPMNDGLAQRFQVLVWPDPPKEWNLVDRAPDPKAIEQARLVFERLANMPAENPKVLKFSPDAQRLFNAWESELEPLIRGEQLHPALIAHLAKYRSLMPVLAALFELADWAPGLGDGEAISLNHAQQSAALCDFLQSHARRVYSCVVSPELRAARELARHIKGGELGERFTLRGLYRHDWSGLATPGQARAAVELLSDAGWVRSVPSEDGAGRPSETFGVNPAAVEGK
jgi:putative DNA primase/helicase